jgi:phenylacetate-CoA ligase
MYEKIVKHIVFPLHEKILGRDTYKYLDELEALQYSEPGKLEEIRFRKLQELMIHAGECIPFYQERFADANFNPSRMQSVNDLKALPLLTKAEIRKNIDAMKWGDSPGGLTRYNTGGSRRTPGVLF